jgi:cytochrome c1
MTAAWMEAWLHNPQALVPGTIEPRHSFSDEEVRDLTAYLLTLKQAPATDTATAGSGGQK